MAQFERTRFPDGQIGVKRNPAEPGSDAYLIKERINSYEDLIYIRSIAEVLDSSGQNTLDYRLFIPCLFGQRSDRRFGRNQSFDLKVIAEIINNCNFGSVVILDPHSDVSMALINRSLKVTSLEYVEMAIKHYHNWNAAYYNYSVDPVLVSPDAGAFKKVFEYGQNLGLEVVGANKHRDKDGKVDLLFTHDVKDKYCFIVDDICDGGYTFLVLADALRKKGAKEVYLYVTHGIFSKGFYELSKQINHIYCTNSVKDIDVESYSDYTVPKEFLTQFNVI